MRYLLLATVVLAASSASAEYTPTQEREFREFVSSGCNNHDGDFLIRGMVSSANENTLVLSDVLDSSSTMSVTLPGRGGFSRVRGAFGQSKNETVDERLNELRANGTLVLVTLECRGEATPFAKQISYANSDGTQASIAF